MKIVMINDCASVAQTILKFLPENWKNTHIKRSRSLWGKTFGLLNQILKVKGDVYHVHYLLQDCYLTSKLGKHPLIGHAHGSDLRVTINNRFLGGIVRNNLNSCDKIIVCTPDLIQIAKEYNDEVEYIPNPFDKDLFYVKPIKDGRNKIRVLLAGGSDWHVKGINVAIRALGRISEDVEISIIHYGKDFLKTISLANSIGLKLRILPKTAHGNIRNYYWSNDVIIDQFPESGTIGNIGIEAIACGRPIITYISPSLDDYKDFPLLDVNSEREISEAVLSTRDDHLWKEQYKYVIEHHYPDMIIARLIEIYEKLIEDY